MKIAEIFAFNVFNDNFQETLKKLEEVKPRMCLHLSAISDEEDDEIVISLGEDFDFSITTSDAEYFGKALIAMSKSFKETQKKH